MAFCTSRIRPKVVTNLKSKFSDELTSQLPEIWRGNDVKIEVAFFEQEVLQDITCFDSVNMVIKDPANLSGGNIYTETVAYADLNRTLVLSNFVAGTDQHAAFEIPAASSRFDMLGENTRSLWLVFYALTTDTPAKEITLGATLITVHEDGAGSLENSPTVGDSIIPNGAVYDGSGNFELTTAANKVYVWDKGANDTSLINGVDTITADEARFTASATSVTLTGTVDALVTAMVYSPSYYTAAESDARYQLAWTITDLEARIGVNETDIASNVVNILKAHGTVHLAVTDEAAMIALVAEKGDIAIRDDKNRAYWLNALDATTAANWIQLPAAFNWLGAYNAATTYGIGDAVFRGSSTFISQQASNLNNDPDLTANVGSGLPWGLVAQGADLIFSTAAPQSLAVGGSGAVGASGRMSHSDHKHAMPSKATGSADGFLAKEDKARFDLSEIGSANGSISASAKSGNWIYLIGSFTTWNNAPAPYVVKIDTHGKADPLFSPGTGFDVAPSHIKVMANGNILVGHTSKTSYKSGTASWVHMITPLGAVDTSWISPATMAVSGVDELLSIEVLEDKFLFLTHRTLRVTGTTGTTVFTETGDADFNNLAVIGCTAYLTSVPSSTYGATDTPQSIKALDFCEDSGGVFTGSVEALWATQGGVGWLAGADRIIADANGRYIVAGGSNSHDGGTAYDWGAAANVDGSGMIKLNAGTEATRGTPFSGFDFECTKNASSHVIPLAIDSLGRIYFTGNMVTVNGTAVTAWNLYRVDAQGLNLIEYTGFAGGVPTSVTIFADELLLVTGNFGQYGELPTGRALMMNSAGERIHVLESTATSINVGSYRERTWDAGALTPPNTDPATAAVNSTTATNRVSDLWLYADAVAQQMQIKTAMPQEWNGNPVKMKLVLQGEGAVVAGNAARFAISIVQIEDSIDIDSVTWPAEVEIDTTLPDISAKIHSTVFTVTPAGAHTLTATTWIRVRRLGAHANDTAGDKVRLHQVRMQYKEATTEPLVWA
jgi:hypothetical protein